MQSAIPLGTVLQHRYRLIKILGQGGFGCTYLAEDQGRFNEPCALKEFIPVQAGSYALEKSKELFRREAQVLYQIQHPQIPQFAAVFEENQRLFLVQDFVEGKTYHQLLRERQQSAPGQAKTFSEPEVIQFLRQMLPVLEHIHTLGIIHRDISPDNIMLRQSDQQPVLIDFGVVNEIATQVQSPGTQPTATRVGKLGYAPVEQLQTGQVSPSSDLYALAVTAIVLLTGKEPQQLLDQTTLRWNWQPWATVRPAFATLLNRMLAQQPRDRYPSAPAVEQALQQLDPLTPTVAATVPPNWSEMKTLAVGRSPASPVAVSPHPVQRQIQTPQIQALTAPHWWERPGLLVGASLLAVALLGWGAWRLIAPQEEASIPSRDPAIAPADPTSPTLPPFTPPDPEPEPDPPLSLAPEPTPDPDPEPEPLPSSRRLNVVANQPLSESGQLQNQDRQSYTLNGLAGQQLYLSVGGGVLFRLFGPDQTPLTPQASNQWQGNLPSSGDYTIELETLPGREQSEYTLNVDLVDSLDPLVPDVSPEPEPIFELTPEPAPEPEPIFEPSPEPAPEPLPEPVGEIETPVSPELPTEPKPDQPIEDTQPENPPLTKPDEPEKPPTDPEPLPPVGESEPTPEPTPEVKGDLLELLEQDNQQRQENLENSN